MDTAAGRGIRLDERYALGILLLIPLIWGTTYPLVQGITQHYPPLSLVALRFGFAALGMGLLVRCSHPGAQPYLGRQGWGRAFLLGITLYVGFATHTLGVQQTTVAKGSLFTALNVIVVPILALVLLRQRIGLGALVGILLGFLGMAILVAGGQTGLHVDRLNRGDGLV